MNEPTFDKNGHLKLIDPKGDAYCLTKETWEIKTKRPEREFLKLNFDKIELTITYPEKIRRSTKNKNCKIFYRKFSRMTIREGITVPWDGYVAIVVNERDKRIETIYPARKIKQGEEL